MGFAIFQRSPGCFPAGLLVVCMCRLRLASLPVFCRWHGLQTACPLERVSPPPSVSGTMWSASVAFPVQRGPRIWQVYRSLPRTALLHSLCWGVVVLRGSDPSHWLPIACHLYAVHMSQQLAPPTNALALAGFILGCVSASFALVLGWLGLFIGFVPALLAIVFGFVGITTANRMSGLRKSLATWAVVLGFAALVIPWLRQALFGF